MESLPDGWVRPDALETARGALQGVGYPDPLLARPSRGNVPARGALEAAILPALQRAPCVVTFSGGRDSSVVLAVAVGLARRHGLAEPVPVTRYWPAFPESDESKWQELVVRHLGLKAWERVAFDEMDVVGPHCVPSLLARGPLWPPLIHTWPPIFELARGGAILTGEGGDELFDPVRCTILRWVATHPRRAREPQAIREVAQALAPKAWRRRQAVDRVAKVVPEWLLPGPSADYLDELIAWEIDEPLSWLGSVSRLIGDRSHRVGLHNFAVMASEHSLSLLHPFHDPRFVLGCAREGGRFGFPGRTAAMRALFGEDLPDAVLARKDKIFSNKVMLSSSTRAFADEWSGRGIDEDLVDAGILRACWRRVDIPVASILPLQTGWCADHREHPPGSRTAGASLC